MHAHERELAFVLLGDGIDAATNAPCAPRFFVASASSSMIMRMGFFLAYQHTLRKMTVWYNASNLSCCRFGLTHLCHSGRLCNVERVTLMDLSITGQSVPSAQLLDSHLPIADIIAMENKNTHLTAQCHAGQCFS